VLSFAMAALYTVVARAPNLAGQPGDVGQLRLAATIFALCFASLFVGHVLAAVGLTVGWSWARLLATLVCVVWCLTCVGLPLGLLVLNAIWRGRPRPAAAAVPPQGL
jgi:ABC-type glycerol-3-phosphate transport system permease component